MRLMKGKRTVIGLVLGVGVGVLLLCGFLAEPEPVKVAFVHYRADSNRICLRFENHRATPISFAWEGKWWIDEWAIARFASVASVLRRVKVPAHETRELRLHLSDWTVGERSRINVMYWYRGRVQQAFEKFLSNLQGRAMQPATRFIIPVDLPLITSANTIDVFTDPFAPCLATNVPASDYFP